MFHFIAELAAPETLSRRVDIQDLATIICTLCTNNPSTQLALNCGHVFCQNCVLRPGFETCPVCRTSITSTAKVIVGAMTIARKDDVELNVQAPTQDHSMDGQRPGDIDDIIEENNRLIREMQEQDAAGKV